MVREYGEWRRQDKEDIKFYPGKKPFEIEPFTVKDITYLIARITLNIPDQLHIIHAYYFNDFKWRPTCFKCDIEDSVLRNLIKWVRKQYTWLRHQNPEARPFSLREIITLITKITFHLTSHQTQIIQGYYHQDGNWYKTCEKCNISKNRLFRCLNNHIRKPYLTFLHSQIGSTPKIA